MYYLNKIENFNSSIMKRWFFTTNHKRIGIMYMIFGVFNGFLSILLSGLMRLELSSPGTNILFGNDQFYNAITTMHGVLMLFVVVMPILFGGLVLLLFYLMLYLIKMYFNYLYKVYVYISPVYMPLNSCVNSVYLLKSIVIGGNTTFAVSFKIFCASRKGLRRNYSTNVFRCRNYVKCTKLGRGSKKLVPLRLSSCNVLDNALNKIESVLLQKDLMFFLVTLVICPVRGENSWSSFDSVYSDLDKQLHLIQSLGFSFSSVKMHRDIKNTDKKTSDLSTLSGIPYIDVLIGVPGTTDNISWSRKRNFLHNSIRSSLNFDMSKYNISIQSIITSNHNVKKVLYFLIKDNKIDGDVVKNLRLCQYVVPKYNVSICFYDDTGCLREAFEMLSLFLGCAIRINSDRSFNLVFSSGIDSQSKVVEIVRDYLNVTKVKFLNGKVYSRLANSLCTYKVFCKIEDLASKIVQQYPSHYSLLLNHLSRGLSFIGAHNVLDNFNMIFDFIEYQDFYLSIHGLMLLKTSDPEGGEFKFTSFHYFDQGTTDFVSADLSVYFSIILGKRVNFISLIDSDFCNPDLIKVYKFFRTLGKYISDVKLIKGDVLALYGVCNSGKSYLIEMVIRTLFTDTKVIISNELNPEIVDLSKLLTILDVSSTSLGRDIVSARFSDKKFVILSNSNFGEYFSKEEYNNRFTFVEFNKSLENLGYIYEDINLEADLPFFVFTAIFAARMKTVEDWVFEINSEYFYSIYSFVGKEEEYKMRKRSKVYQDIRTSRKVQTRTVRSYSKVPFLVNYVSNVIRNCRNTGLSTPDFAEISKIYYANKSNPSFVNSMFGNNDISHYLMSGRTLCSFHIHSGMTQGYLEYGAGLVDNSNSIHPGECAMLNSYKLYGKICVTRNCMSEKIDMLITNLEGKVLGAYQFKDRSMDIHNLDSFLNMLKKLGRVYRNIDTPFGYIEGTTVVVDIRSLPADTKVEVFDFLQGKILPRNVQVWDTSASVGESGVFSPMSVLESNLSNPVFPLFDRGEIVGGEVVFDDKSGSYHYRVYSHNDSAEDVILPIKKSSNDIIICYVCENVAYLDLICKFLFLSTLCILPLLVPVFCTGFICVFNRYCVYQIKWQHPFGLALPLYLQNRPVLMLFLPLFVCGLPLILCLLCYF